MSCGGRVAGRRARRLCAALNCCVGGAVLVLAPGFAHVKRRVLLCRVCFALLAYTACHASVMLGAAVRLARMRRLGCYAAPRLAA